MGNFLEADFSYLETLEKKVARILVNLNLREGLAESINLDWGPVIISQILDYENVPFHCRRCHAYGHPMSECSLLAFQHNGNKGRCASARREGQPAKKDRPHEVENTPVGVLVRELDSVESNPAGSMVAEDLSDPP